MPGAQSLVLIWAMCGEGGKQGGGRWVQQGRPVSGFRSGAEFMRSPLHHECQTGGGGGAKGRSVHTQPTGLLRSHGAP